MLVVSRFDVGRSSGADFLTRALKVMAVMSSRPGYQSGRVGRAADDPELWLLMTEWQNAGAYRRAMSNYDVRVVTIPLMRAARDEPSTFEILGRHHAESSSEEDDSDRVDDPGSRPETGAAGRGQRGRGTHGSGAPTGASGPAGSESEGRHSAGERNGRGRHGIPRPSEGGRYSDG